MVPPPKLDETTQVWVIDIPAARPEADDLGSMIDKAVAHIATDGGGTTHLWLHEVSDPTDHVAHGRGFVGFRDLWQLQCPLPAARSTIDTRAFTLADAEALVGVNNRAFSWHPEQSGMTVESLTASTTEPWFNAEGFRLLERNDELIGFCWTKVHNNTDPVLGEIYVIAVDPSAHGQGLGTPMTLAGLDWLSDQGITTAMLYVESDNDAANATYRRIGFTHHHTDRAYALEVLPSSAIK
jgi:mycothiol synthase